MAMAFAQTGPRRPGLHTVEIFGVLTPSGNYATDGDVIDFTALGSYWRSKNPLFVMIQGKAGFVYQYDIENKKVLVFTNTAGAANAALGQHTAAAYVAGVTGDVIRVRMIFPK